MLSFDSEVLVMIPEKIIFLKKFRQNFIEGIQSKGVGCCIKHLAANNQEFCRLFYFIEVDERTFREIYLASFDGFEALKEGLDLRNDSLK